jgi:hypothetical protein
MSYTQALPLCNVALRYVCSPGCVCLCLHFNPDVPLHLSMAPRPDAKSVTCTTSYKCLVKRTPGAGLCTGALRTVLRWLEGLDSIHEGQGPREESRNCCYSSWCHTTTGCRHRDNGGRCENPGRPAWALTAPPPKPPPPPRPSSEANLCTPLPNAV